MEKLERAFRTNPPSETEYGTRARRKERVKRQTQGIQKVFDRSNESTRPDRVPTGSGQVGAGAIGRGKRHRRAAHPALQSTTQCTRLAGLKVEDVQDYIGPAIQQNNMPANHHMSAVRRRRRQPALEFLRTRLKPLLEPRRKRPAPDQLPFQAGW